MDETWHWFAAIGIPLLLGVFGIWWRAHINLSKTNTEAHRTIHDKIDQLDQKSEKRHNIVIDMIVRILHGKDKD